MKKVIRLTESDLENIVRKVIMEQSAGIAFGAEGNGLKVKKETKEQQTPQESQGLWKDGSGNAYKLTCVNSNDSWYEFVNWANPEMNYSESTSMLRKLGTQWKSGASNFSPFNQGLDYAKLEKMNDYQIKQVDFLHRAFSDGLTQVAIQNPPADQIKRLRIKSSDDLYIDRVEIGNGADYTDKILKFIPNYFDILAKLAEIQKKKLGCA